MKSYNYLITEKVDGIVNKYAVATKKECRGAWFNYLYREQENSGMFSFDGFNAVNMRTGEIVYSA